MSQNELQKYIIEILSKNFAGELSFQTGNPSEQYFWYRKRKQVADLIKKNITLFRNNFHNNGQDRLFVDIGCGEGLDLFLLRDLFEQLQINNYKFLGLEGFPLSYEIAKAKNQYLGKSNIDFALADLTESLPIEDDSVDVIYCSEVVEHMVAPENIFNEFRRVLKPRGFLILTTPNEPNILQKSFWLPNAAKKVKLAKENTINNPRKVKIGQKDVFLYGHISCRKAAEWDSTLDAMDFNLVDYRRGALVYGGRVIESSEFVLGFRLICEGILDFLPRSLTRQISDEMITLYKLGDKGLS